MSTYTDPLSSTKSTWNTITECRSCKNKSFRPIIDLGMQYIVDFPFEENPDQPKAPLLLVRCLHCNLVQLMHTVSPELLFRRFWYRSGISESMRDALHDVVDKAQRYIRLNAGDNVLDIGSNDGTLLDMYPGNVHTVGIEPCKSLGMESIEKRRVDVVVQDFFSKDVLPKWTSKFKVITAIAMFYDVEDPRKFIEDCRDILADDGLLIIQMNYLKTMLKNTTVDNISHEHLTYWSLAALYSLAISIGLEIKGVEVNSVNGGSFRVYMTHKGKELQGLLPGLQDEMQANVVEQLQLEHQLGISDGEGIYYEHFLRAIMKKVHTIRDYIKNTAGEDAWYVYGASTRGTSLLQLLDMKRGTFVGVAERDPNKFGRKMVSGWIPIYSEDYCRERAKKFLVLPYHFIDQILEREKGWLDKGGEMLFPLPDPVVYTKDAKRLL